ncbi:MAG TPA: CusA/CzcA family heavy metal efflux RND transporter, partial [Candidatus Kapabacteria bacterium]|nr:CusA/CzcA family heavy metal efflux RND transporter [Candidatus Kapabacteria bacterium]
AVPDITNNQVQIITLAPTLSAQETEQFITAALEMNLQTIPDIIELRSISRFGLSVITVVFEDHVDIYKARQLVGERLREAEQQIPKGFGTPELAPVSTGLGEIYQYVLHPKKGFESKYSPMELRTIEDWIVRRQLLGTPGVADVSSFGGYVKQYEIAVNPSRLKSMNVSLAEIFTALEKNNENTGGAYIEKKPNAYFIRGIGLAKSIDDLEKIVIRTNAAGIPLLIRDVAAVQFGSAVRYGAMTRNDNGEVVGALVLMLKGANSAQVIETVKERIEQIKKTLPEGVEIEPFIDRTKLVDKAIGTVTRNLLEGGLIVIFILVLLLGNLRAGLVVASVIPLAMLFAISMMNLFGISGNLMSLGAIDFGLIVDGAVIIVESIVHRITISNRGGPETLSSTQMDTEVFEASSRIRKSAAFGEIIILIVYIPILTLVGVEGKMFRPMAQTVGFAVLGALILSLTYVPMISALALSKKTQYKKNISDRIMDFFHRLYNPVLEFSLKQKLVIVGCSITLLLSALFLFLNMGGEFIPTLEEGDFAVEVRLMQGASLSQTVETTLQAGGIIKKQFPEVIEVVGKIGTSEIPTDPMPINSCDLMIILKDKHEWTSAKSREELAEKMGKALSVIPGVEFGFQQPIQMRFNELMTGVRQDVAVKIFGEDMEMLAAQADQVANIVKTIPGTQDIYTEKVSGLPQVQVEYNRDKMSQYGLSIAEVNDLLATAFAGKIAGVIFEGEKRFDLVVRMDIEFRQSIDDVRDLYVTLPSGNQVSIEQIANVEFKEGPTQVSRENANRRIFVGFNVRGRDVESVVEEIQHTLDTRLKLPPGYYLTYGGQFENLQAAKERLSIVLPIALFLIFILLYFTFRSLKQSLLIFTAI